MVGCSSRGKLHCCGGQCLPRLPMHQRHHHRHCLRQHQQRPQDTTARTTIRQPCDRTQNRLHNTTSAHEPCRWVGACVGQIRGVVGLHARSAAFGEGGCVFAIPSARCVCHARTHALCNNTISKSCPARDGAKELLVRRWGLEIKNQNKTWPSGHFLGGLNMAVDFGGARNQLIQHRRNSSWAAQGHEHTRVPTQWEGKGASRAHRGPCNACAERMGWPTWGGRVGCIVACSWA